jgi:hypothetical protein
MESKMNQQERVLAFLQQGKVLPTSTARNQMGVGNPAAVINKLRANGVCIYTNMRNGQANYRIGPPREKFAKAAFAIYGAAAFE